mgnify:CR=1 FL=1
MAKRKCKFGKVKRGRRKGACLKSKRSRKLGSKKGRKGACLKRGKHNKCLKRAGGRRRRRR